jgi:hypothetical protein
MHTSSLQAVHLPDYGFKPQQWTVLELYETWLKGALPGDEDADEWDEFFSEECQGFPTSDAAHIGGSWAQCSSACGTNSAGCTSTRDTR